MTAPTARRRAVGMLFFANGLSMPALLPRLPQVRDAVGADPAAFGLALLGTGVGGIAGSVLTPRVLDRWGPRRAAVGFALVLAGATVLVGAAASVPALFAALGVMGLTDGIADISQNHLMFEVQRTSRRSLISRMHALWSTGAVVGAGIGTAAAAAGISVLVQTAGLAVVAWAIVLVAVPALRWHADVDRPVPTPDPQGATTATSRLGRGRRWVLVAVAAVTVAAVEGIANEWSALTLRDGLGAGPALAGAGPLAFAAAMLAGRLLGDRAIDAWGRATTARAGAAAVVVGSGAGLGLATLVGSPVPLVAGLAVAGVGAATLFPSMLSAGDHVDATGRGVAVAASSARAGLLGVPLVMGGVAQAVGFTAAFVLLPVVGVVAGLALPAALGRGADRDPVAASGPPPTHW